MRDVPQAASLFGVSPMTRQVLIAIGAVLLTIGGSGIIARPRESRAERNLHPHTHSHA